MIRPVLVIATLAAAAALVGSCQPDVTFFSCTDGGTAPGTDPVICIVSPPAGTHLTEFGMPGMSIGVEVAVGNFTLRDPGQCGVASRTCGHVHLIVDHGMCTQPGGLNYTFGSDTTLHADLAMCPQRFGMHTITVELHDDFHAPLSPPVSAEEIVFADPL